jgi:hypothetical protein
VLSPAAIWNQQLPGDVPLDPNSATYVATLAGGIKNLNFLYRDSSIPVVWASETTPRQKVWVDVKDGTRPKLKGAFASVPLPSNLRPPGPFPGDNAVCICCRKSDGSVEYFEFFGMRQTTVDGVRTSAEVPECSTLTEPGWHCLGGAAVKNLNLSPGYVTQEDWPGGVDVGGGGNVTWGCSASKTLLYHHTIKIDEAQRLHIPHALRLAIPKVLHRSEYRWPALGSDGTSTDPSKPPTGAILTFNASETFSDVSDPFVEAVCRAIRDYGLILTDSTSTEGTNAALKCETQATVTSSEAWGTDAWKGPENKIGSPGAILWEGNEATPANETAAIGNQIPLSRLKVVATSYRPASVGAGNLGKG